jgi:hypothetical protein
MIARRLHGQVFSAVGERADAADAATFSRGAEDAHRRGRSTSGSGEVTSLETSIAKAGRQAHPLTFGTNRLWGVRRIQAAPIM